MIVPTATGVSVREAQRVDCTAKDASGALVNRDTRECSQNIGDIYWDCRKGLTEGSYKCEHKTCKHGEAISNPATNSSPSPLTPSSQMQLPDVLVQETGSTPLPPLSRQSILDALQDAPSNTGQDTVYRSPAADSFEKFMLEAGLAPGGLVPGTGNLDAGTPLSQTPNAADAARLQGGIISDIPATRVPTSQEERGAGGPNTFAPSQVAQFSAERPVTWEDRISTFLGCTVGYFFGGCDSATAQTEKTDAQVIAEAGRGAQPDITILAVTPNVTGGKDTQLTEADIQSRIAKDLTPGFDQLPPASQAIATKNAADQYNRLTPESQATVRSMAIQGIQFDRAMAQSKNSAAQSQSPAAPPLPSPLDAAIAAGKSVTVTTAKSVWDWGTGAVRNWFGSSDTSVAPTGGEQPNPPASVQAPREPSVPVSTTPLPADMDTKTPAEVKEIEAKLSASKSQQLQEDEERRNAAIPKSSTALQNNIFAGLFKAIGGGGTEDLQTAWKEAALARSDAERAVPVIGVEVAELPPLPGARSEPEPALAMPGSGTLRPPAESPAPDSSNFAELLRRKGLTEYIIEQKRQEIEAARTDLQARTDAAIAHAQSLGYSDITQSAAWPVYEKWWKEYEGRVEAFTAKVDAYRLGDTAVMQELDAALRTRLGGTSEGITRTIDAIRRNSDDIWNQTPSFWEDPVAATLGGATRLTEQAVANLLEADRNLLERAGPLGEALGFSDSERALGRIFDPIGANDQLAKDVALVAGTTVAPWAAGRVAGAIDSFGGTWAATLPRSVTTDIRVSMGESAGFPTTAARGGAEVAAEPTAPSVVSSVSSDAAAIARTEAAANEIRAFSGKQPVTPTSGSNPYTAFDNAVADARAGAAQSETAPAVSSAVEAPAAVAPTLEKAAESGSLSNVSAGSKVLESGVDNLTMKSWVGGAGATAGILCLGFCPSSEPLPQEAVPAEIVPLSTQDLALLFPQENKVQEPPAPQESSMPVGIVVDETPALAMPSGAPRVERETPAPVEQPAISPASPSVAPPVLTAPPLASEGDSVAPPARVEERPQPGMSEFERFAEEQQKIVGERIEEQRRKNQEAFDAWEEAKRAKVKEIQDKIAQLEKAVADMNLPSPTIVPQDTPQNTSPGAQGVGLLTADEIAAGLMPNPASAGSRRQDLEINFEFGSAMLTNDGRDQVAALARVMSRDEFRNSTFNIVGHTDTVGTADANLTLSRQRAQAIVDILNRDYGIPLGQMKATGAGQWVLKVPILGNVPANRRVEIVVTPRR